jgi:hypothetical protein
VFPAAPGTTDRITLEKTSAAECRMVPAQRGHGRGELHQTCVPFRQGPVQPGDVVVLTVPVVVAVLRAAHLVTGHQHGHALGQEKRGEEVSDLGRAQREHCRIVGLPLHATVP